jgi:hypothetical protein
MATLKIVYYIQEAFPAFWAVQLPDGSTGSIKYRFGYLSVITNEETFLLSAVLESERIGNDSDETIRLEKVVRWLEARGYIVEYQHLNTLQHE